MKSTYRYALTGAAAGAINGFFGGGGGMALVPLLSGWCGLEGRKAFATSVAAILPMCAVSAAVYFFRGGLPLTEAVPYLAGGLAGGILGGITFKKLPVGLLQKVFGALLIAGGVRAFL